MHTATLSYLNHRVEIKIPDPEEDNQILISIYREEGTYNPDEYNADLTHYQFSAESSDPNEWLGEGVKSAVKELSSWGIKFYESWKDKSSSTEDLDFIPF